MAVDAVLTPGARCGAHPEARADGICSRCGSFLCLRCRRWQAERMLCVACHTVWLGQKPSSRAVLALALATIGFCGFVTGPIALVLAYQELHAIRDGRAPGAGESYATFARNLGWFHVAMLVVSIAGLVRWILSIV